MPEGMRAAVEQQQMESDVFSHDRKRWLESLDEDGLRMLKALIFPYTEASSAAYLMGVINGQLELRYGTCEACGKKHDEQLAEMTGPGPSPKKEESPITLAWKAELLEMAEYEVGPVNKNYPKVYCLACGAVSQSLDDRKRRKPGNAGCESCIDKQKWG